MEQSMVYIYKKINITLF